MTDQCKHCTLRGNLRKCLEVTCPKHTDWIVAVLQERVRDLEDLLRRAHHEGGNTNPLRDKCVAWEKDREQLLGVEL
jgi:hypothetical protein